MTLYPKLITDALATVRYPGTGKNIVESGMLEDDIRIDGMKVSFSLVFEKKTDPFRKSILKAAETAVHTYVSEEVEVSIGEKYKTELPPEPDKLLPGVRNIVAVSSGKGGVGKSTVAANLAIGLVRLGYRVGLLDTDIFGPSLPKMFDVEEERPYAQKINGRDMIIPIEKYGVKLMSIGFFIDPNEAALWRGAMACNALKQFISEVEWGTLDYLVLDTPPGTSDIHLTLLQMLGITGAVIVSTPQEVALADARKGISMYKNEKVNVPILGLVENMSWFTPASHPEEKYFIFGDGGCKRLAEEMEVPLLAQIPLVQDVCECGDAGTPSVVNPATITGNAFLQLAAKVVTQVDKRNMQMPRTERVKTDS